MSITVGETEAGKDRARLEDVGAGPITAITWEADFDRALELASAEGKQVLVDFFNPN